jgi:hypothetical protein
VEFHDRDFGQLEVVTIGLVKLVGGQSEEVVEKET